MTKKYFPLVLCQIIFIFVGGALATTAFAECNTVSDGLVACYALNGYHQDSNGRSTIRDASEKENDGEPVGSIWGTTDRFNNNQGAFQLSGGYIKVTNSPSLNITGSEMSISMWIKQSSYSPNTYLILNRGDQHSPWAKYSLDIPDGASAGRLRFTAGGNQLYSNSVIPTEQWTHIIAVYQGSSRKIYLNGVLDAENSIGGTTATSGEQDSEVFIGSYLGGGGFFNGSIDHIRIYNRAISEAEIKQLYKESDSCLPATYVNGVLQLPTVTLEGYREIYKVVMQQYSSSFMFRVSKSERVHNENSCPAIYFPRTGTLDIPLVKAKVAIPSDSFQYYHVALTSFSDRFQVRDIGVALWNK